MLTPLDKTGKGVPLWLLRFLAEKLLTPALTEGLFYWRAQRLYWEGVAHSLHSDGGREEQEEIHVAEGAETAIRRLADHFGVERLPSEGLTHISGLEHLHSRLEADERRALKVLDRLGPSRRIPLGERPHDYMEASDAEATFERLDRVHEYLDWLKATRSDAGGYEVHDGCEVHSGQEVHDAQMFGETEGEEVKK